jgi:hypothetical protein
MFIMYFLTAVVSNSAPMAAAECLLQSDGQFAGINVANEIELPKLFNVEINDFFTVSLISLVISPIIVILPFNIVWWIILSPFSRIFSCGRKLRFGKLKRNAFLIIFYFPKLYFFLLSLSFSFLLFLSLSLSFFLFLSL